MVDAVEGAGTRTFKLRGGMGLLGVMGKYGMYRNCNMMALLDVHVRGVKPEESKGGRNWSNYTWHGDQAPGVPFVTGLQNPDCDFNDMRNTRLHVGVGKNLVENKMADAHFFIEIMERGGKIVTITPEYSPPATKADYWIPCRPGLGDTAIFLAVAKTSGLSGAARLTGISAPTLGRRMTTLERQLNQKLFDRKSSGYVLTEAGRELYEHVREMEAVATGIERWRDGHATRRVVRVSSEIRRRRSRCATCLLTIAVEMPRLRAAAAKPDRSTTRTQARMLASVYMD